MELQLRDVREQCVSRDPSPSRVHRPDTWHLASAPLNNFFLILFVFIYGFRKSIPLVNSFHSTPNEKKLENAYCLLGQLMQDRLL